MIATLLRVAFLRLTHSYLECMVVFVVPLVFFTVFALIFERQTGGPTAPTTVFWLDFDASDASRELANRLAEQDGIRIVATDIHASAGNDAGRRARAEHWLEMGRAKVAIVVPPGYQRSLPRLRDETLRLELLTDSADPVAGQTVQAALAQLVVQARMSEILREMAASRRAGGFPPATLDSDESAALVAFDVRDVLAARKRNPKVSMHAAGIAVMFLLFGAVGAAGTLLEEEETGTLERLLASGLSMSQLLLGKWLFLVALGCVQVTVMFVWGQLLFGIDLVGHLPGFAAMTLATSAAAASFALVLATACRTRTQLNGVAVIVILCMSALGGSMVPRYVMSDQMQRLGLLTFNGWALDGYNKVFWRDLPLVELLPQLFFLGFSAIIFFLIARVLAQRWAVL